MDKAKLTAPETPQAAEGAQLLASMMASPPQSDTEADDCHMARLAGRPLPLISFLSARRSGPIRQDYGRTASPDVVLGVSRPDLGDPPRQPSVRRGLPAGRDNPGQPALAPSAARTGSFEPSQQDRDQAIDLTKEMDGLRAAAAVLRAGVFLLIALALFVAIT